MTWLKKQKKEIAFIRKKIRDKKRELRKAKKEFNKDNRYSNKTGKIFDALTKKKKIDLKKILK